MLWVLKPRISISDKIAFYDLKTRDGIKSVYGFKIINRTWFYRVLDIRCELLLLEDVNSHGGTNIFLQTLSLRKDQAWYIKRRFFVPDGEYALVLHSEDDLIKIWDSYNKRLQFQLICKHSLSGFSKSFVMTYYHKDTNIKKGKFRFGDSFEIK